MGHIFISYSHKDKVYAHKLAEALEARGFDAWIDHDIDYGASWPTTIQDKLDACDAFIVIVSENSSKSDWVQSEVARAKRKGKPIFPLQLSGDMWLSLEATQYVDVKNRSLPPEQFYECLRLVTSKPEPPAPEPNPGSNEGTKRAGRGCEIEVGRILRVAVLFALFAIGVIFSIQSLPLSHPPTPTPFQPGLTRTAISPQGLTPSNTPPGPVTPTITSTSTPAPVVIVDTSTLMGWAPNFNSSQGNEAINKVEAAGNAIKLSYDIGQDGYVVITKSFDPGKLSNTEGISFMYQGLGAANTIEFKLLLRYPGDTEDTTYGILLQRATNTAHQWQEVKIPYREMSCWWPARNCAVRGNLLDKSAVNRLDFVISNKPGDDPGSGWILIKDVFGIMP